MERGFRAHCLGFWVSGLWVLGLQGLGLGGGKGTHYPEQPRRSVSPSGFALAFRVLRPMVFGA